MLCDLRDLEDEADEWIYLNHIRDIRFAEPHFGKDRLTAFGNAMNSLGGKIEAGRKSLLRLHSEIAPW